MCRVQVLNYCPAVPSCPFSQKDVATLYEATINASWHCNNVVLQTHSKPFFCCVKLIPHLRCVKLCTLLLLSVVGAM